MLDHNGQEYKFSMDIYKRLDKSRAWAAEYQRSQRAIDKELNPGFYDKFIRPDGSVFMVEKSQIPEEWQR